MITFTKSNYYQILKKKQRKKRNDLFKQNYGDCGSIFTDL